MMAYGFGARHIQDNGPACNLFSMNGDMASPYVRDFGELIDGYEKTLKSVKLTLPVLYKNIV
jgi:hypothetical protein